MNQLDADIWRWLDDSQEISKTGRDLIERRDRGATNERDKTKPLRDDLAYDICDAFEGQAEPNRYVLERRDHLIAIVQFHLRRDLERLESGADDAALRQWRRWKQWYFGRHTRAGAPELLYGNWESLLDHLCEGSLDLTDQLFTQLEHGRMPSLAHKYLAFLQSKITMPLVLTTNFDSLLEQAFHDQGISPKVFDIHRDADLPDPALVRRQFSLMKLHGSAYGLRLGERLKYPLDPIAREHVLDCIPEDSLLLVIGFSGYERRMLQLLHAVASRSGVSKPALPSVFWLTLAPLSGWPEQLVRERKNQINVTQITDANLFLQELYFRFGGSFPAGRIPYRALAERCVFSGTVPPAESKAIIPIPKSVQSADLHRFSERWLGRRPIHIFEPFGVSDQKSNATSWSTLATAAFVHSCGYEYRPIWIDFENHHTVSGIVAEIFSKVKEIDPSSPQAPLADPRLEIIGSVKKVVERIREVFRRGRFILILDAIECFGRPQLMHHGIPTYEIYSSESLPEHVKRSNAQPFDLLRTKKQRLEKLFSERVDLLKQFMSELIGIEVNQKSPLQSPFDVQFGESYICVAIGGPPRIRFPGTEDSYPKTCTELRDFVDLMTQCNQPWIAVHRQVEKGYESILGKDSQHVRDTPPDCPHIYPQEDCAGPNVPHPHWRRKSQGGNVQNQRERTQKRLHDILHLLHDLRSADAPWSNRSADAFLGFMALLRRPRGTPLLRSLTERWVLRRIEGMPQSRPTKDVHHRIDEYLKRLCGSIADASQTAGAPTVGRLQEGGSLWLFREIQESVYESLTEQLSAKAWVKAWRDGLNCPPGHDPASSIVDGLVAITWHWAAARTYYADVYRPTQDIEAFYEYMYHRISALRVITLLLAVLANYSEEVTDALSELGSVQIDLHNKTDLNSVIAFLGVFEPLGDAINLKDSILRKLRLYLFNLRREGLETLLKALERNRGRIRQAATPQTIEAWAGQFLERERDDLDGSIFWLAASKGVRAKEIVDSIIAPSEYDEIKSIATACMAAINGLTKVFEELRHQATVAQLAFEKGLRLAITSFSSEHSVDDCIDRSILVERAKEIASKCTSFSDNEVRVKLRRLLVCASHLDIDIDTAIVIDRVLKHLEARPRRSPDEENDFQLFYELKTKNAMKSFLPWKTLIDRSRLSSSDESLQETEHCSYQYENVLRATATTRQQDGRHRSSAIALRSRSLYLRAKFRQAHRWLDLAAASLEGSPGAIQVSQAVVHLYRAELLAVSADDHYGEEKRISSRAKYPQLVSSKRDPQIVRVYRDLLRSSVSREQLKLERAERELEYAEACLRTSPHAVLWAIRLDLGAAVIRQERLLFQLEHLYWDDARWDNVALARHSGQLERDVLEVMRRLRSVLDALPYEPNRWHELSHRSREPLIGTERMAYAVWQQLFVVSAAARVVLRMRRDGTPDASRLVKGMSRAPEHIRFDLQRWDLWARSMRFQNLAAYTQQTAWMSDWLSLLPMISDDIMKDGPRKATIRLMNAASSEDKLNALWDARRT